MVRHKHFKCGMEPEAQCVKAANYIERAARLTGWILGVSRGDMFAPERGTHRVAYARSLVMYMAYTTCEVSMVAIGRAFGRDRTTVGYHVRGIAWLMAFDDIDFEAAIERLMELVKNGGTLEPHCREVILSYARGMARAQVLAA